MNTVRAFLPTATIAIPIITLTANEAIQQYKNGVVGQQTCDKCGGPSWNEATRCSSCAIRDAIEAGQFCDTLTFTKMWARRLDIDLFYTVQVERVELRKHPLQINPVEVAIQTNEGQFLYQHKGAKEVFAALQAGTSIRINCRYWW